MLRTGLALPERPSSRVCPLPMPARPCTHSAPRTQPMKSSRCSRPGRGPGRALVTGGVKVGQPSRAPGQTLRPGQVQTACLAPRYRHVRAGRLPTAPVTTNYHLRPARGAQAAGTSTGSWGLPGEAFPHPPTPATGSGNLRGGTRRGQRPAAQEGAKQRGVGGKLSGEGWAGWSQVTNFPA